MEGRNNATINIDGIFGRQRRSGGEEANRGGRHWYMVVLAGLWCSLYRAWKRKKRGGVNIYVVAMIWGDLWEEALA